MNKLDGNEYAIPALSEICTFCRHLRSAADRTCDAFPKKQSIPMPIWLGDNPHATPYPGDHGIRFEALPHEVTSGMRTLKDAGTVAGAMAHGPGGLLATPGLGTRRRKWGNRKKLKGCTCGVNIATKEQIAPGITRIHGNLCNVHGRYGPCDASLSLRGKPKGPKGRKGLRGRKAAAKPKKPVKTPEQRAAERQAKAAQNRADALSKLQNKPNAQAMDVLDKLARGEPVDPDMARALAEETGLVQLHKDGHETIAPTGRAFLRALDRGDAGAAADAFARAQDMLVGREERQSASEQRKQAAAQRKQEVAQRKQEAEARRKKAAEQRQKRQAGQAKQRASAGEERQRAQQQREQERQQRQQQQEEERKQREQQRQQQQPAPQHRATPQPAPAPKPPRIQTHRIDTSRPGITMPVRRRGRMQTTNVGTVTKATWTAAYVNDLSDGSFLFIESGGKKDSDGKTVPRSLRHFPYKDANGKIDLPHLRNAIARIPQSNAKGLNKDAVQKRAQKMLANANKSYIAENAAPDPFVAVQSSFTVFKDDTDAYRWLARTTTAYRDRDGEIITTKALEDDAQRMTATKQYGPLRYWHIGKPDPFHPTAPWGKGVDIGDCDYSTVIGRTSIESGTFKSHAIGAAFARSAGDYELSPGFFHPLDEPNEDGEYDAIHRFERSVVPIKYGRASNLFTGMTVKEHAMDQKTYDMRVKTFLEDMNAKGVDPAVTATALQGMEQADKSAQQQGIAYKSDDAPVVYQAPDGSLGIIQDGRFVSVVAAGGIQTKADAAMPAPDEETPEETMAEGGEEEPGEDQYIGDMTPTDFRAFLIDAFQEAIQQFGSSITTHMGALDEAVKGMGYARTKAEQAQTTEIAQLKARLAQLEGDQPSVVMPEVEEAFKSDGPQAPPDPNVPQVPNDPNRPFAALSAAVNPALYGGSYGPNGWSFNSEQPKPN